MTRLSFKKAREVTKILLPEAVEISHEPADCIHGISVAMQIQGRKPRVVLKLIIQTVKRKLVVPHVARHFVNQSTCGGHWNDALGIAPKYW